MAKKRVWPETLTAPKLDMEAISSSVESADDRLMPLLQKLMGKVAQKVTARNIGTSTKTAIKEVGGGEALLKALLSQVGKVKPDEAKHIQSLVDKGDLGTAVEMADLLSISKKSKALEEGATPLMKAAGIGARGRGRPKGDGTKAATPKVTTPKAPITTAPVAPVATPTASYSPKTVSPNPLAAPPIITPQPEPPSVAAPPVGTPDPEVAERVALPIDPSAEAPFATGGVPVAGKTAAAATAKRIPKTAAELGTKTGALGTLLKYALGVESPNKAAMKTALRATTTKGSALSQKALGAYLKNPVKGNLAVGGAMVLLPMLLSSLVGGAAEKAEDITGSDLTAGSQIDARLKKLQMTDADTLIASMLAQQYRAKQAQKAMQANPGAMQAMRMQQALAAGQVPGDQPIGADALGSMGF